MQHHYNYTRLHYTKVTFVCACVCVCVYEREVTGSHWTRTKKFPFLDIAGLGRYYRQPTDTWLLYNNNILRFF
jgi:hypothetical protein